MMDALNAKIGEASARVAEVPGLTRARRLLLQGARAQCGSQALGRIDALWSNRMQCKLESRMFLHPNYGVEWKEARSLLCGLFPFVRELIPPSSTSSISCSGSGGGSGIDILTHAHTGLLLAAGDSHPGGASNSELASFAWAYIQACILSFYYIPETVHSSDNNSAAATSGSDTDGEDIGSISFDRYLEVAERCLPLLQLLGQQHPSNTAATNTAGSISTSAAGGDVLSRLVSGLLIMLATLTASVSAQSGRQAGATETARASRSNTDNNTSASDTSATPSLTISQMRFLEAYVTLVISSAAASTNRRKVYLTAVSSLLIPVMRSLHHISSHDLQPLSEPQLTREDASRFSPPLARRFIRGSAVRVGATAAGLVTSLRRLLRVCLLEDKHVEELGTNSNSSSNYGTVNVVARMIQQYQYQQQHGADAPKSGSRAKLVASSAAAIGSDSSGVSSGASGPMSPEYVAMAFQVLPQEREEGEGVAGHRGEASDSSNYSEMKKARLARAAADSTQTATPTTISAHNAPSDIASGVITGAGGSKHGSTFTSELFSAISAHLDKTYRAMHNGSSNRGGLKETGNSNDFDASDYDDISLGIGFLVQDYFEASREMLQAAQASALPNSSSGATGQAMSSSFVVHQRRHCIRVLHFAFMMLQACSRCTSSARASATISASANLRYALCLVRCRSAVLASLASELRSVALSDHPSLSPYRALLRAQYGALLADLKHTCLQSAAGGSGTTAINSNVDSSVDEVVRLRSRVLDGLLWGVVSLIAVDHRPVVEGEEAESGVDNGNKNDSDNTNDNTGRATSPACVVLVQLLRALRAVDLAALAPSDRQPHHSTGSGYSSSGSSDSAFGTIKGDCSGAEAVLLALIKLYHDLRIVPDMIRSFFEASLPEPLTKGSTSIHSRGVGDHSATINSGSISRSKDGLLALLRLPGVRSALGRVFASLPQAQMQGCWKSMLDSSAITTVATITEPTSDYTIETVGVTKPPLSILLPLFDVLLGPIVQSYSSRQQGIRSTTSGSISSGWAQSRLGRPLAEVPVSAVRAAANMVAVELARSLAQASNTTSTNSLDTIPTTATGKTASHHTKANGLSETEYSGEGAVSNKRRGVKRSLSTSDNTNSTATAALAAVGTLVDAEQAVTSSLSALAALSDLAARCAPHSDSLTNSNSHSSSSNDDHYGTSRSDGDWEALVKTFADVLASLPRLVLLHLSAPPSNSLERAALATAFSVASLLATVHAVKDQFAFTSVGIENIEGTSNAMASKKPLASAHAAESAVMELLCRIDWRGLAAQATRTATSSTDVGNRYDRHLVSMCLAVLDGMPMWLGALKQTHNEFGIGAGEKERAAFIEDFAMALASAAMLSQAPSASPCGRTGETPLPWSNQWSHQSEDEEKELERRMLKSHLASAEFLESELVDRVNGYMAHIVSEKVSDLTNVYHRLHESDTSAAAKIKAKAKASGKREGMSETVSTRQLEASVCGLLDVLLGLPRASLLDVLAARADRESLSERMHRLGAACFTNSNNLYPERLGVALRTCSLMNRRYLKCGDSAVAANRNGIGETLNACDSRNMESFACRLAFGRAALHFLLTDRATTASLSDEIKLSNSAAEALPLVVEACCLSALSQGEGQGKDERGETEGAVALAVDVLACLSPASSSLSASPRPQAQSSMVQNYYLEVADHVSSALCRIILQQQQQPQDVPSSGPQAVQRALILQLGSAARVHVIPALRAFVDSDDLEYDSGGGALSLVAASYLWQLEVLLRLTQGKVSVANKHAEGVPGEYDQNNSVLTHSLAIVVHSCRSGLQRIASWYASRPNYDVEGAKRLGATELSGVLSGAGRLALSLQLLSSSGHSSGDDEARHFADSARDLSQVLLDLAPDVLGFLYRHYGTEAAPLSFHGSAAGRAVSYPFVVSDMHSLWAGLDVFLKALQISAHSQRHLLQKIATPLVGAASTKDGSGCSGVLSTSILVSICVHSARCSLDLSRVRVNSKDRVGRDVKASVEMLADSALQWDFPCSGVPLCDRGETETEMVRGKDWYLPSLDLMDGLESILEAVQKFSRASLGTGRGGSRRGGKSNIISGSSSNIGMLSSGEIQEVLDAWSGACLRVAAHWIPLITPAILTSTTTSYCNGNCGSDVPPGLRLRVASRLLRLLELAVSVVSEPRANAGAGFIAALVRDAVAMLCAIASEASALFEVCAAEVPIGPTRYFTVIQSPQPCILSASGEIHVELASLVRQLSRLLSGLASLRVLNKYVHLLAAAVIHAVAQFPRVKLLGGGGVTAPPASNLMDSNTHSSHASGIDLTPIAAGLFCMFDRCRSSRQRADLFGALGPAASAYANNSIAGNSTGGPGGVSVARMLLSDLHEVYVREYKFAGAV